MEAIKKIGILVDRLHVGGVQKVAIEQTKSLIKLGYNAQLLVLHSKCTKPNFKNQVKDLPVVYLDQRLPKFLRFTFKFPMFHFFSLFHLTFPVMLPFVVKKKEWEVIISNNTYSTFTSLSLKILKNINYAYSLYDPIFYILNKVYIQEERIFITKLLLPIAKVIDKFLISNALCIIYFGKAHQKYIENLAENKNTLRLPLGAKLRTSLIPKNKKNNCLITVSSWKPGKKLEKLIELTTKLDDIKLKIIGSWVDQKYLIKIKKLINKRNINARIKIINRYLTDQELNEYYAQARALIIINPERGFGLPVLEAASQGTPSVAPIDCGVNELFENKKEALFFKNLVQAKNYLKKVNNKDYAYQLGKKAWKKVKNNYSWGQHTKRLISYIENLND